MADAPNKKTLYEILGVEPAATAAEIHAAYEALAASAQGAAPVDAARQLALKEAHGILCNERRRAAYDQSLRQRDLPPPIELADDDDEGPGPGRKAAWVGLGLVLIAAIWWFTRTPAPKPAPARAVPAAVAETAPAAVVPAAATAAPTQEPVRDTLLHGATWRCQGPLTGRGLELKFAPDGTYAGQSDGQPVRGDYKLAANTLTLSDSSQTNPFAVEELAAQRLVISRGEGRRLTCTR